MAAQIAAQVCHRSDEDGPPDDFPARTLESIERQRWLTDAAQAS